MDVVVNGKTYEVPEGANLADLIVQLGLRGVPMVAEVDGVIVPREDWAAWLLQDGARVELVRFVGGG
jgi:thiamine biosynthesis protein ThiS